MSMVSGVLAVLLVILALSTTVGIRLFRRLPAARGLRWGARISVAVAVQMIVLALVAGLVRAEVRDDAANQGASNSPSGIGMLPSTRPTRGWVSTSRPDAALLALSHPVHTAWGDLWRDSTSTTRGPGATLDGQLAGPVSHLSNSRLHIWLPEQYQQPGYVHDDFPVVLSLTGYTGNPLAWWKIGFPRLAQADINAHRIPPFVFVALPPYTTPSRDTECTDVPKGPQAETFLARDVPDDVRHLVRASALGRSWAVMGVSTGGYCAVKLTLDHPTVFASAVSFGGYVRAITDHTTGDLDGRSAAHRQRRDLIWLVAHEQAPAVSIFLAGATGDGRTVWDALWFADAARPPISVTRLVTVGGGHTWPTFDRQLPQVMNWLAKHLIGPAPTSSAVQS